MPVCRSQQLDPIVVGAQLFWHSRSVVHFGTQTAPLEELLEVVRVVAPVLPPPAPPAPPLPPKPKSLVSPVAQAARSVMKSEKRTKVALAYFTTLWCDDTRMLGASQSRTARRCDE